MKLTVIDDSIKKSVANITTFLQNQEYRDDLKKTVLADFQRNFEEQGRPEKWKELSELTLEIRRNKNKSSVKILEDTRHMRNSMHAVDEGNNIAIMTDADYDVKHQFGDPYNKMGGRLAPIPARPFMVLSPDGLEEINDLSKKYERLFMA